MDNSTTNEIAETLMPLSTDNPLEEVLANQDSLFFTPDPVSEATLNLVTDILVCHVVPLTSAFGIVGNFLSIVVLLSQKKGQSLDFLLIVLAFVDACFLIFQSLGFVACSIRQNDVIAARNFLVITLPHVLWIGITLSRISSMLTVVIAVERCLVVMLPLKVKVWVTSTSIRVTTALACVIPAIAHIPVFMRGEIEWLTHPRLNTTLPNLKLTQFALDNPEFLNVYKNLVLNVLFRYVPMATVSICTGLTIAQLKRYSRWRMSLANDQRDRATICEKDARASATLLRVCVVFIVCSVPGCVMLTIRLIEPQFDFYGTQSNSFHLAKEVNELFLAINSSVNFVIYMRSGVDFRRSFCRICQRTLPACFFNFLFRCVMRPDRQVELTTTNMRQKRTDKSTDSLDKSGSKTVVSHNTNFSSISAFVWKEDVSVSEHEDGAKRGQDADGEKEATVVNANQTF